MRSLEGRDSGTSWSASGRPERSWGTRAGSRAGHGARSRWQSGAPRQGWSGSRPHHGPRKDRSTRPCPSGSTGRTWSSTGHWCRSPCRSCPSESRPWRREPGAVGSGRRRPSCGRGSGIRRRSPRTRPSRTRRRRPCVAQNVASHSLYDMACRSVTARAKGRCANGRRGSRRSRSEGLRGRWSERRDRPRG